MMPMNERQERQARILDLLQHAPEPIRGEDLARQVGVTRQVVVHEIAILRASGTPILSTPRGYLLNPHPHSRQQAVLSVRHPPDKTATELYTLIDHGLVVKNVMVEHPLYGELSGALELRSRKDVDMFLREVDRAQATLLSSLTDGFHMHTVEYLHLTDLTQALDALKRAGIDVIR